MLTLPRDAARWFRAVLRRSLFDGDRGPWPPVLLKSGPDGLVLEAERAGLAVRYTVAGPATDARIAFRADLLARFEGRTAEPVRLRQLSPGILRAEWTEAGVAQAIVFDAAPAATVPAFPADPPQFVPMPDGFLAALVDAAQSTAREATRYALTRVMLKGGTGEVVATDAKQLLVQRGFAFPWRDDLLVSRLPALAGPEFAAATDVRLGRTEAHVVLAVGDWTFALPIDSHGRFPPFEEIIPRTGRAVGRLHVDPEEAAALIAALPKLPGHADHCTPVTLDLGSPPTVRARDETGGSSAELPLRHSTVEGTAVRAVFDRTYLRRALQLGFIDVQVIHPNKPLVARDGKRIYLWMPLDPAGAVPPDFKTARPAPAEPSGPAPSTPLTPSPEARTPMAPTPPQRPAPAANGTAESPDRPGPAEVIAEAEAVRTNLHDAAARLTRLIGALKQQRRHTRAVQQAVASLRDLRLDH